MGVSNRDVGVFGLFGFGLFRVAGYLRRKGHKPRSGRRVNGAIWIVWGMTIQFDEAAGIRIGIGIELTQNEACRDRSRETQPQATFQISGRGAEYLEYALVLG